jgi:hypothetical protein
MQGTHACLQARQQQHSSHSFSSFSHLHTEFLHRQQQLRRIQAIAHNAVDMHSRAEHHAADAVTPTDDIGRWLLLKYIVAGATAAGCLLTRWRKQPDGATTEAEAEESKVRQTKIPFCQRQTTEVECGATSTLYSH